MSEASWASCLPRDFGYEIVSSSSIVLARAIVLRLRSEDDAEVVMKEVNEEMLDLRRPRLRSDFGD